MKVVIAFCLTLVSAFAHSTTVLAPFKATYAVSYRGLNAGSITFELKQTGDGEYVYSSTVDPSALAKFVVSSSATEVTRFKVIDDAIQPIEWKLDDGKRGTEDDGALTFDPTSGRVQGVIENKKIDLPLQPGLQDRLSMQIEVIRALRRNQEPGDIQLIDDERIKIYSYKRGETTKVKTPSGEYDAVLYESTRPKSSRVSRVWHAPALGFVAVRAEQVRRGKVETVMTLEKFEK